MASQVSSADLQRLGRSFAHSKRTNDLPVEPAEQQALLEQTATCEVCTGGAEFLSEKIVDDNSTCESIQMWLNTPEATVSCSDAQYYFGPKCCKDKSEHQAMLDALGPKLKAKLLHIFGEERVLEILELQKGESKKDQITTGLMQLKEDVLKREKKMLGQVAERAADMPGQACSQLPDSVLSHLWRYNEEDVINCLGGEQHKSQSLMETKNCNGEPDEVPHSSGWSWWFSSCSAYGGETCKHSDGGSGCCCPAGRRWDASKQTCIECRAPSAMKSGDTCKLRCAMLPDQAAQLTCGASVKLQGAAPEGRCRWERDKDVVKTEAGPVQGFWRPILWNWDWSQYEPDAEQVVEVGYVRTFWDIPFGKPIEMFKRPEKVGSWAPKVLQSPDFYEDDFFPDSCDTEGVDDCLKLSIYVPPNTTKDEKKPVMFWIPGDGFRMADVWGAGMYDGARYAMRQDCLLVISNGRSSLLGHWASHALADEDQDSSTGNYGLMDQRLAMEWIQANIANFGGDPKRVTIGGHSSGGFSVNFHLFSPRSHGLFSAAITEGSTLDSPWYMQDLTQSNDFYAEIGAALGCPKDQPVEQIACLRKLNKTAFSTFMNSQTEILGANIMGKMGIWAGLGTVFQFFWSKMGFAGSKHGQALPHPGDVRFKTAPVWPLLPIGPCVDGSPAGLPKQPLEIMKDKSQVAQVPVYLSYSKDEGTVFSAMMIGSYPWTDLPTPTHAGVDEIVQWFTAGDTEFAKEVIKHYPRSIGSPFTRLSEMIGDSVFRCSNERFAKVTASQESTQPVYLAETDYVAKNSESLVGSVFGAWHMSASMYAFGTPMLGAIWDKQTQGFSAIVNCHYAFFIHCGNPLITNETECYRDKIRMFEKNENPKAYLRACLDPSLDLHGFDWEHPFLKFNPKSPKKYMLNTKPGSVPISSDEKKRCEFWDRQPASKFRFVTNLCRNCSKTD